MKTETLQLNKQIIPNQNLGTILAIGFSVSVVIHVSVIAGIIHSWQPDPEIDKPLEITMVESVPLDPVLTTLAVPKLPPVEPKAIEINPTTISVKPLPPSPITSIFKSKPVTIENIFQTSFRPSFTKSVASGSKFKSSPIIKSTPQVKIPDHQPSISPRPFIPAPTPITTPFPTFGNPGSKVQSNGTSIVKPKPIIRKSTPKLAPIKSPPASTPIVGKSISPPAKSDPIFSNRSTTKLELISSLIDPNSTKLPAISPPISANRTGENRNNVTDPNPISNNNSTDIAANSPPIDDKTTLGSGDPTGVNLPNSGGKDPGGGNGKSSQGDGKSTGNSSNQTSGGNGNGTGTSNGNDRQNSSSKSGGGLQCIENCQLPKLKDLQTNDSGKDRIRIRIEVNPNGSISTASILTSSGNPQIDIIILAGIEKMKFNPPGKIIKGIVRINIFL